MFGLGSQEQFPRTVQNRVDDDDDGDGDGGDDARMAKKETLTPFFKYSREPLLTTYKPLGNIQLGTAPDYI